MKLCAAVIGGHANFAAQLLLSNFMSCSPELI